MNFSRAQNKHNIKLDNYHIMFLPICHGISQKMTAVTISKPKKKPPNTISKID
ncbi:MAG: hypothetical protein K9J13_08930 [Saprospiraceae bacterium]|nr:hypothetical protein [Saprospiraceae bacterium]